jgi:hypothetical protein
MEKAKMREPEEIAKIVQEYTEKGKPIPYNQLKSLARKRAKPFVAQDRKEFFTTIENIAKNPVETLGLKISETGSEKLPNPSTFSGVKQFHNPKTGKTATIVGTKKE